MRSSIHTPIEPGVGEGKTFRWILVLLQFLCVPFAIWGFFTLLQGRNSESVEFNALAMLLLSAATGYLALRSLRSFAWTSIPVLLTIEMMAGFVFIPAMRFASGNEVVDADYARAMFLVLIGFVGFAIGSLMLLNEGGLRFVPQMLLTPDRVSLFSAAMLGLGTLGNVVVWRLGLFGYMSDASTRQASSGIMQWVNFLASLIPAALVVSAIEVVGKRSREPLIKIVFWLSLLISVALGIVSGLKSGPLFPILDVMLIYGITQKKIPRTVLLLPVLLIVFIYPFTSAYRDNLNEGYRSQINTVGGTEAVLVKSFQDAFLTYGSKTGEDGEGSSDLASSRMSYLAALRDILEVPDPTMLNGGEKLWLVPVYPLVPRFLWKDKPVLNKGQRLSEALGHGNISSSATTIIGDLYSMYGTYGVVIGMFTWGALLQFYMNWIGQGSTPEPKLFIYIIMLPQFMNLESDVIGLLVGVIQSGIIVVVMSYVIYGPRASSSALLAKPRLHGTP